MPLWTPHYQNRARNWTELRNYRREYQGQANISNKNCMAWIRCWSNDWREQDIMAAKEYPRHLRRKQRNGVWHLLYSKLYFQRWRVLLDCKGNLIKLQVMNLPGKGGKAPSPESLGISEDKIYCQWRALMSRRLANIYLLLLLCFLCYSDSFQLTHFTSCIETLWIHGIGSIWLHVLDNFKFLRTWFHIWWSCVEKNLQNTNAWCKSFFFVNVLQVYASKPGS